MRIQAGSAGEPKVSNHQTGREHDAGHPLDEAGLETGALDAQLCAAGIRSHAGRVMLNRLTDCRGDGVRRFRRRSASVEPRAIACVPNVGTTSVQCSPRRSRPGRPGPA